MAEEDSRPLSRGYDEGYSFHLSPMSSGIEEQTERRLRIHQALLQLKPKDAACLHLHYGDGFNYEEIAKIVGTSPEAVRKRIARGVEKLRTTYRQEVIRGRL